MQKRKHVKNPIAGYDLSGFRPKYGNKKQRCWYCGGKNHKSNSCHSIKISQFQRLCWELQDRIEILENALNQSIKAADNRKRKQMVKLKKKKKKKHEEQVKAMDKAVTIKTLLLQDEAVGWGKNTYRYWHLADAKIKEMTPKQQKEVNKCYEQLFGETLQQAMLNPIDIEEVLEELSEAEYSKSIDLDDTS